MKIWNIENNPPLITRNFMQTMYGLFKFDGIPHLVNDDCDDKV